MRSFLALWKKEIGTVFLSPIGYVTIAVYLSATSWTFLHAVRAQAGTSVQLEALHLVSLLVWLPILITVICMRLFSEEKRSGTIETLLTTAVRDVEVVLAKYCGALFFVFLALIPAMGSIYLLVEHAPGIERVDHAAMLGGMLILVCIAMCCTSIGVLVSLLTRNQIVAAIGCFWAICLPFMLKPVAQAIPYVRQEALDRLSVEQHVLQYAGGIIHVPPALFYLSVSGFMLFAAVRILESRRWL